MSKLKRHFGVDARGCLKAEANIVSSNLFAFRDVVRAAQQIFLVCNVSRPEEQPGSSVRSH